MKFILATLFLSLLTISFTSKRELPKIEIYRLKDFFKNPSHYNGLPGEFRVTKEELADTPLIKNEEILSYDTIRYNITFSKSGVQKIKDLKPFLPLGVQFAITVDKKPVITGYILNKFSSYGCASFALFNIGDSTQYILKGLPEGEYNNKIPESRNNRELIDAFKITKRVKGS
ncbi:MAG: hypothetical protein QM764_03130 [Chitinophagaceae bacterium]